jgi:hypothetical protein
MPTSARAAQRRFARPRRRPRRVAAVPAAVGGAGQPPPPGPAAGLPDALLAELAVVLADLAWALYRKEDGDDATRGEP